MGAKLHWKYGSMNAGKTTVMMMIAYDYEHNQHKKVLVAKPYRDTKGNDFVVSRLGDGEFKRKVNELIYPDKNFYSRVAFMDIKPDIILVDEAQFLTKENVMQLVDIVTLCNIPVICFGLRSDFMGKPFEGSSWLFAVAQDIEEIGVRTICGCGSRATMNVRLINHRPVFNGEQVSIDGVDNVTYSTRCLSHFMKLKREYERGYLYDNL